MYKFLEKITYGDGSVKYRPKVDIDGVIYGIIKYNTIEDGIIVHSGEENEVTDHGKRLEISVEANQESMMAYKTQEKAVAALDRHIKNWEKANQALKAQEIVKVETIPI